MKKWKERLVWQMFVPCHVAVHPAALPAGLQRCGHNVRVRHQRFGWPGAVCTCFTSLVARRCRVLEKQLKLSAIGMVNQLLQLHFLESSLTFPQASRAFISSIESKSVTENFLGLGSERTAKFERQEGRHLRHGTWGERQMMPEKS